MKYSRWLSLLVLCTGFLLIVVDMTIVNVALPSIGRDLRLTPSGLAWVINAYLVAFAGLLLLAGRLADLAGGKRVFLLGLGVFTAASLACGLSTSPAVLIAARFVQGVGGAASSAVILAMIVTMFPEPGEQAKAFGIFSFVASAGAAVGLVTGGVLTQAVSWHSIFFVNVPIGLATAFVAHRLLPSSGGTGLREGADVLGAALVTGSLMLGVYAIVSSSGAIGAVAATLLAVFFVRQARASKPMLPLRLFRSRTLSGANAAQALMSAAFLSFFFLASLDLERVLGYGPLALGLGFLPVAVVMGSFSIRFAAGLVIRFGAFRVLVSGQLVVAAALFMLALGPDRVTYVRDLLLPMALLGLGGGLTFPALTVIAMSEAPPADSGLASGLLNTTGQVGGALGLAIMATIAAARTAALGGSGETALSALAAGYHTAWLAAACAVIVAIAVTLTTLRPRHATATPTRDLVEEAA
ncbi:MAG TPA: MFS transporter [Candidatus Eisenbacteria bacterium]|nr:MFS transporter [Candidatus Eisenbacteria bacterium]